MSQLIEREETQGTQMAVSQPMRLLEMAIQSNADVDKLEKLMALQERWNEQQAKKSYFDALSQMQSEMPVIRKLSRAEFSTAKGVTSYSFAKLEDIVEQIKPLLSKFGFSFRFEQSFDNGISINCITTHRDGHSEACSMVAGADMSGGKNAIQQIASTVTYLRRYTLTGAFGISTADADIDGRMEANDSMNSDAITPDSLAKIQALYDKASDAAAMWAWLCGTIAKRNLSGFEELTQHEAERAIKAMEAKR